MSKKPTEDDDFYAYQARKTAPKPAYKKSRPEQFKRKEPELPVKEEPMEVEESTASDTIIEKIKAFWRK
jgi:hypothetical protein